METNHRLDILEPGDKTALVCTDVPEMERLVVEQMREFGYKVHTGFYVDDLLFKLRTQIYDVLIVAENFGGMKLETNPLLAEAVHALPIQRHRQLLVLVGASVKTADEIQAFQHSVDLVVNLADIKNLRLVVRRALNRAHEFYGRYFEALAAADVV
jgi:CheY-like chemotaxis protein